MKIKLTPIPIPVKKVPTRQYVLEVKFMHGDADLYTDETYVCEDENDFKRIVSKLNCCPPSPACGGETKNYKAWEIEAFLSEDFIPWDKTGYDCPASYDGFKGFYYDENGVKFKAEIV